MITERKVDTCDRIGANTETEMRDFARVLRQALLMIVRYLEKRYHLGAGNE